MEKVAQIKLSDSMVRREQSKVHVAVNCTNEEALNFFTSIDNTKPHVKLSIKCGVDVEKMDDHGDLVYQLDDASLGSLALYFRSKDVTECLDCVMRTFTEFVIGSVQLGSEL